MNDILKIVKSHEEPSLLTKWTKRKNDGFLGMLLGTLGASLLGNL